jgi:3-hydroxyisobutyrate dehydrogenase
MAIGNGDKPRIGIGALVKRYREEQRVSQRELAAATGPLADAGAVVAASAWDAVRDAGVVITMLPTADAVESVMFDGQVAEAFADGCVWAQMGTIGVEATLRIRDLLAARRPGVMFVDAPVSGSKGPAEQGQLLILASGPAAAADASWTMRCAPGRSTTSGCPTSPAGSCRRQRI